MIGEIGRRQHHLVARIDDHAFACPRAGDDEAVLVEGTDGLGLDYDHAVILAILDDLLFTSKIRGAATQAGATIAIARSAQAALDLARFTLSYATVTAPTDGVVSRITLPGAIFLTAIAVLPQLLSRQMNVPYMTAQFFGGTGVLIIVGVTLDTMRQVESHLLMRHYDGFLKKGRIKGRF